MVMAIQFWQGYHEKSLLKKLADSWSSGNLLILCPPLLRDTNPFLRALQESPVSDAVLGIFTSGTLSSSPRLILYSRENILTALNVVYDLYDRDRIEHIFCYPQPFHTFGMTLGYMASILFGWELHAPEGKYSSGSHRERLDLNHEKTVTLGTPTHFLDLMNYLKVSKQAIPASYSAIIGGAPVSRSLWLRLQSELNIEAPSIGYGCTEASPAISHLAPAIVPENDAEIGIPVPSLKCTLHEEGVEIQGANLCTAIVQNGRVERPRSLVIRDRIRVAQNGRWIFEGRTDLTLNRGGQKISLEDVENCLTTRINQEVLACRVANTRLGEELGIVVIGATHSETNQIIRDIVLEQFGVKLQDWQICFQDTKPINSSAKVDRLQLESYFT